MTTERSEAVQCNHGSVDKCIYCESHEDTNKRTAVLAQCSREELEAQYSYQSAVLAKLVERAGGVVTIPADAWQGDQQLKRLWFSQSENGDITVELKVHE